jgi:hypothetical protein
MTPREHALSIFSKMEDATGPNRTVEKDYIGIITEAITAALAEQRRESAILARDFILKRCGCNKGVGHACGDGAPCNCPHHDIDIAIRKETP